MRKKELLARVAELESEREILIGTVSKLVDRLGEKNERKTGEMETR